MNRRALGLVTALILLATLVLTLIPTGTVLADSPLTIIASKDVSPYQGSPTSNFGATTTMYIRDRDGNKGGRIFCGFDLSGVPEGAEVTSATLSLYRYGWGDSGEGRTLWAYKLTRTDWVEAEATWNIYKTGSDWTTPGGDYVTSDPAGGSFVIGADAAEWMNFDVKAIVEDAIDNESNAEFLVRYAVENRADHAMLYVYSKEYADDTSLRPKLVIEYTTTALPTVVTNAATDVSYTTATVAGNITVTGGADATTRGFEWGTDSGGPYPNDWHEDGTYGTGTFSRGLTGLTHDTVYYYRAYAENSEGTSYGAEGTFTTLLLCPGAPTDLTVTQTGTNQVTVSWVKGTYAADTIVVMHEDSYPTAHTADYEAYSSNGTSVVLDGLSLTIGTYYFSAWSENDCGVSTSHATAQIGGTMLYLILLGGLASVLLTLFVWKRLAFLSYASAGIWALLAFSAFNLSASPNPATITDTYMGLFWMGLGLTIACALIPTLLRPKPEPDDYPMDALGDDLTPFSASRKPRR